MSGDMEAECDANALPIIEHPEPIKFPPWPFKVYVSLIDGYTDDDFVLFMVLTDVLAELSITNAEGFNDRPKSEDTEYTNVMHVIANGIQDAIALKKEATGRAEISDE